MIGELEELKRRRCPWKGKRTYVAAILMGGENAVERFLEGLLIRPEIRSEKPGGHDLGANHELIIDWPENQVTMHKETLIVQYL